MPSTTRTSRKTTLYLPGELLAAADKAARAGGFRSRNELVAEGIRRMVQQINRDAIDTAFAAAASDEDYQGQDKAIQREFEAADVEAFRLGEID